MPRFPHNLSPRLALTLAALLAAGCGSLIREPPWVADLGYRGSEIEAIAVGRDDMPYVAVRINGNTARLLFDSGNTVGIVLHPRLAKRLGLRESGRWNARDAEGRPAGAFPSYTAREVHALGRTWKDLTVYGGDTGRGPGSIGAEPLFAGAFTLDAPHRRLAVTSRALREAAIPADTLPLYRVPGLEGWPVTRVVIGGRSVLAQLDTGRSRTRISPALARALAPANAEKAPGAMHREGSGRAIAELRLGSRTFSIANAEEASFGEAHAELPGPIEIGLGCDVLGRLVVTVDYRRGMLLVHH